MCRLLPTHVALIIVLLAGRSLADAGDDFSNNLFSDLAPLLALFGERVTTQFMSESLGISDCIILAMAPIGIITMIVGAIRVGGPLWLKAIIGRARENVAEAEMELMSSTSREVCELYNGQSIVRCQGAPNILEFVCLLKRNDDGHQDVVPSIKVMPLNQAVSSENKLMTDGKGKEYVFFLGQAANKGDRCHGLEAVLQTQFVRLEIYRIREENKLTLATDYSTWNELCQEAKKQPGHLLKWFRERRGVVTNLSVEDGTEIPPPRCESKPTSESDRKPELEITILRNMTTEAPNVSLNRHNQISRVGVHSVAAIATGLQSGVLIFFGFITYSPRLQPDFKKDGNAAADYAFPMAATGTIMLVLGLFICAYVVENVTDESEWRPKDENTMMQVIWIQQKQTVGDQMFNAFATYPKTLRTIFRTSRRSDFRKEKSAQNSDNARRIAQKETPGYGLETLTVVGTGVALLGFISQFIGLRGMNWAASVAQLIAILIMVTVRAWVRRGLAQPLNSNELRPHFELDWLAIALASIRKSDEFEPHFLKGIPRANAKSSTKRNAGGHQLDRKPPLWTINTGFRPGYLPLVVGRNFHLNRAQTALTARREVGKLANLPGSTSDVALRLTRTIEAIANILVSAQFREGKELKWDMGVTLSHGLSINASFRLSRPNAGEMKWKAYADEIASALSLWIYSAKTSVQRKEDADDQRQVECLNKMDDSWLREKGPQSELSLRIMAPRKPHILQELRWWIPDNLDGLLEVTESLVPQEEQLLRTQQTSDDIENQRPNSPTNASTSIDDGMTSTDEAATNHIQEVMEVEESRIVGYGFEDSAIGEAFNTRPKKFKVLNSRIEDDRTRLREFELLGGGEPPVNRDEDKENGTQKPKTVLAIKSSDDLTELYAKDFLYAFISSVAKTLEGPIQGNTETRPSEISTAKNWKSIILWNETITELVREVESNGFGASFEAYLTVIAPLSIQGKLPFPQALFDLTIEKAQEIRRIEHPLGPVDAYLWLVENASYFSGKEANLFPRALLQLMGSMTDLRERTKLWQKENWRDGARFMYQINILNGWATATDRRKTTMERLIRLCKAQGRPWDGEMIKRMHLSSPDQALIGVHGVFDEFKVPKLHQLAFSNPESNTSNLRELIGDLKASLSQSDVSGWTPLHYAAAKGNTEFVRTVVGSYMFEPCMDINAKDLRGWTPLHYACLRGHEAVVQSMISVYGLDMSAQGIDGVSPLHCAARNGHLDIVRSLIKKMDSHKGWNSSQYKDIRTQRDHYNRAAVHRAVSEGHNTVAQYLAADVGLKDVFGWTAFHLAIVYDRRAIVKQFMQRGTFDIETRDNDGRTPLLLAAERARWDIVRDLVEASSNIDVNVTDLRGKTPLLNAVGNINPVKWLTWGLESAPSPDISSAMEIIKLLVERGAEIDIVFFGGTTPLHMAAARNLVDLVEVLLKKRSSRTVDAKNENGKTALELALKNGNEEIVKLLKAAGATSPSD